MQNFEQLCNFEKKTHKMSWNSSIFTSSLQKFHLILFILHFFFKFISKFQVILYYFQSIIIFAQILLWKFKCDNSNKHIDFLSFFIAIHPTKLHINRIMKNKLLNKKRGHRTPDITNIFIATVSTITRHLLDSYTAIYYPLQQHYTHTNE